MEPVQQNEIVRIIREIADDVLRDVYSPAEYRTVILPMVMLDRLDAVLESTRPDVLATKSQLDSADILDQDAQLRQAAGQTYYNTSQYTLRDLISRSNQQLSAEFEAYIDGFSPNVQEILNNLGFLSQITRLLKANVLGKLIGKFLDSGVNFGPNAVLNEDGSVKSPGVDNEAMGTLFEALVCHFTWSNMEEAGEHTTPLDVSRLMSRLMVQPVVDQIEVGNYSLYDGACGTGTMLAIAGETLQSLAQQHGKQIVTHLYGQEIDVDTFAISKATLLLRGHDVKHIVGGPDHSTLSNDAYPTLEFDFMLSNPPHGKSWKSDLDRMGGKNGIKDSRFIVEHGDDPAFSLLPRSNDAQSLFLANLISKMKKDSPLGSRIVEIHSGPMLYAGDSGQSENNVRRWIIEHDWLEAIIALPQNLLYNNGAATYLWVLTNHKTEQRQGKVQLIDASAWHQPLVENLAKKTCELTEVDIQRICDALIAFEETDQSKIVPNAAFGNVRVTVERPPRLRFDLSKPVVEAVRQNCVEAGDEGVAEVVDWLAKKYGSTVHKNASELRGQLISEAKVCDIELSPARLKILDEILMQPDEKANPVIRKVYKAGKVEVSPLYGRYEAVVNGKPSVVEYESDPTQRDTEQISLLEEGGLEGFFSREVWPYKPDAWIDPASLRVSYEIPFARYFYKPQQLRGLDEIRADILAIEQETDSLLTSILNLNGAE